MTRDIAPTAEPQEEGLIKLAIELDPSAWHGYAVESVWVEPLSDRTARIDNVPFYALGMSCGDVVEMAVVDGRFQFVAILEPGGHSTYRIFLLGDTTRESPDFRSRWAPLEELGCSMEGATERLLAIDVPPDADIHRVCELLEAGERSGTWDFEEGHCGHFL